MNQNDNIRIMRYFDRFAPYEELKELYEKCLPPIRRFENQMMEQDVELTQFRSIIVELDTKLTAKCDRNLFQNFQNKILAEYGTKAEQKAYENTVSADMDI